MPARLPRSFFTRDATVVARELLGHTLVTCIGGIRTAGRITETEAYMGADDPASHAHRGPTARNRALFLNGGHAYVYVSYGVHLCFNVSASVPGIGQGVLFRAVQPLQGLGHMMARRGRHGGNPLTLANGPGKLTVALGITMEHNRIDLLKSDLVMIEEGTPLNDAHVIATPRIGITKAADLPWRWVAKLILPKNITLQPNE